MRLIRAVLVGGRLIGLLQRREYATHRLTIIATDSETPVVPRPELGRLGRALVAVAFLAGLAVAYSSGLGLVFYVPFAGVGSLLVIKRPRTSIGWMLAGVGWGFAVFALKWGASVEQVEAGTLGLADAIFIVAQGLAGMVAFLLLAVLAVVFPSGRLPSGRWGRVVRIGFATEGLILLAAMVEPTLNVNVVGYEHGVVIRNPIALLPDLPIWALITQDTTALVFIASLIVAGASLGVRFGHATGVERQQLKWLGVAIVSVVLGVGIGMLITTLSSDETGSWLPWVPAMLGFVGVPVSILVAVMRYRLYEIDTIINRAIVYGLLTAILAGGSAAAIGLGQRLFSSAAGPGSDATIVVTTLLVVTAFNPIKTRLQAMVDRRFKDVHGPAAILDAFVIDVRRSLSPPDLDRTIRRLLDVAVEAYRTTGGVATVGIGGDHPRSFASGTEPGDRVVRAIAAGPSTDVEVRLAATDLTADAAALQAALSAVVAEAAA